MQPEPRFAGRKTVDEEETLRRLDERVSEARSAVSRARTAYVEASDRLEIERLPGLYADWVAAYDRQQQTEKYRATLAMEYARRAGPGPQDV